MFGQLDSVELRTGLTLAGVIAFRMLGLFMILPVFMLLAADMPGFSPAKAGLAVGIYGLTQAVLQQPFGKLSDRFGRRPVMLAGLALFAAGGVVAALADSIEMMIAGRALQGCGAIAGVALAFAADHTRVTESKRDHGHYWYGYWCFVPVVHDDLGAVIHAIGVEGAFLADCNTGCVGDAVGHQPASGTRHQGRNPTGTREILYYLAVRAFGILITCSHDLAVRGFAGNAGQSVWF